MRVTIPIVVALALVAPVSILAANSRGEASVKDRCFPEGSRTLLKNDVARVYTFPLDRKAGDRGFSLVGCLLANGSRSHLVAPSLRDFAFLAPAISLAGPVVGYAETDCPTNEPGDEDRYACRTHIGVDDLSDETDLQIGGGEADSKRNSLVKVGSLRGKKNGSVAWIACPERGSSTRAFAKRGPNCIRPGDEDVVYKSEGGRRFGLVLDRGRLIDPSSLRRSGSRITWINGGKRRSATLD